MPSKMEAVSQITHLLDNRGEDISMVNQRGFGNLLDGVPDLANLLTTISGTKRTSATGAGSNSQIRTRCAHGTLCVVPHGVKLNPLGLRREVLPPSVIAIC